MFAIEATLKILGYTFRGYLKNKWNVFDGMLVIVSFVDIVLSKANIVDPGQLSIFKVLRLVSRTKPLKYSIVKDSYTQ